MFPLVTLAFALTPAAGADASRAPRPSAPRPSAVPVKVKHAGGGAQPVIPRSLGTLDPRVLQLALDSAACAMRQGAVAATASTLTLIDYSRPSTEPRLWVVDLATRAVLFEELVAHGSGSGGNLATRFSNDMESHQSSLGLFTTENTYFGKHGYSLRLHGLERGINDRARDRAIVMHGASYVSEAMAASLGRLGRSWGCPALRPAVVRDVIDRIKGGNVVFAYYPDPVWLASSKFLTSCGAAKAA